MEQLLKIESVPVSLNYHIEGARLELQQPEATLDISREKGGLVIKSDPIRLKLDTYEAQASTGKMTPRASIADAAQKGVQMGYEAIGRIAEDGDFLMDIHLENHTIAALAARSMDTQKETAIKFIPSEGPDISWEGPQLQMRYQMDKLSFDWRVNHADLKFIPGNIEVEIEEYAKVMIDYVGDPIYVPPSAQPGFEAEA